MGSFIHSFINQLSNLSLKNKRWIIVKLPVCEEPKLRCYSTFTRLENKNLHLSSRIQPSGGRKGEDGWVMLVIWTNQRKNGSLFSFILIKLAEKTHQVNPCKMCIITTAGCVWMRVRLWQKTLPWGGDLFLFWVNYWHLRKKDRNTRLWSGAEGLGQGVAAGSRPGKLQTASLSPSKHR